MLRFKIGAVRLITFPFVMGAGLFMIPLMWLEEVLNTLEKQRNEAFQPALDPKSANNPLAA